MKAISLKQPWAGLIACGAKNIETRKWKTNYRGELLICSSKKGIPYMSEPYHLPGPPELYKHGSTICLVNVVDCVPMEKKHEEDARCYVYEGAWAWILENIRPVRQLPVKGQLSIFDVNYTYDDLLIT